MMYLFLCIPSNLNLQGKLEHFISIVTTKNRQLTTDQSLDHLDSF